MNIRLPISEGDVESLVRAYLEEQAANVDVAQIEAALATRLSQAAPSSPLPFRGGWPGRLRASAAGRVAVAACLCVAVAGVLYFVLSPQQASAVALVDAAHKALAAGPDRCYRVEGQLPLAWLKANPYLQLGDQTLVWTRGDRFRVTTTSAEREVQWGQDDRKAFWLVDGRLGFRFQPHEVPPVFGRTRAFLGLDVRQLLQRFLDDYDLKRRRDRDDDGRSVIRVDAVLKAGKTGALFDAAWLEIDPQTKLIRRMHVERRAGLKGPHGLTFTLVEQAPLPDASYRLEAHLPAGGKALGPEDSRQRDLDFQELLAARRSAAGRIRPHSGDKLPLDNQ